MRNIAYQSLAKKTYKVLSGSHETKSEIDIVPAPVNEMSAGVMEGGLKLYDYCGLHNNAGRGGRTKRPTRSNTRNAWDNTRRNAMRSAVRYTRRYTGNGKAYPKIQFM